MSNSKTRGQGVGQPRRGKAAAHGTAAAAARLAPADAGDDAEEGDSQGDAAINLALGARMRTLRAEQQLTLEELSHRSSVSRAMLSKVERGEKSPTLPIVVRIANGFGIPLSTLLGAVPDMSEVCVLRASQQVAFRDAETGFERWVLSPAHVDNGLEFVKHRLLPGRSTGALPAYASPTEKYIAVAKGRLAVATEGRTYALREGDAMYFEVRAPYSLSNPDPESGCTYYMVIVRKR